MKGIKGGSRFKNGGGSLEEGREENAIEVQGLRGLDLWHRISLFFFYFYDNEL